MAKLSFAIFPFRKGHPAPGGNGNGTSNESVFQATDLPTLSCSACSCRNCPWRCLPAGKNTDIQLCEPSAVNQCAGHHFFTYEDYLFGAPTLSRLFKTNGFPSGTVLVKDIFPGGNSSLNELTEANGLLFFRATDATHGSELWKSDGTAAGTVLVKDIDIEPMGSSNPGSLTNVNGLLFFWATDATHGSELWKSDGTAAGTVLVKDRPTGGMDPEYLTNVNGTLFFSGMTDDGLVKSIFA